MKQFNLQYNVGKAKYVINVHDGVSKHPDGSPFYGVEIFKNKKVFNTRIRELMLDGFIESATYIPRINYKMFGDLDALARSLNAWSIRTHELNELEKRTRHWKFPLGKGTTYYTHTKVNKLIDEVEVHVARLIYVNVAEVFVKSYFYENYFNLSDDVLKTYDALTWFEHDFILALHDTMCKQYETILKYAWYDLIGNDDLFVELIYGTWKKVEKDIESKTLKLELF